MSEAKILIGDARERLAELEDNSVQTCITSPPYFGLRDYGHGDQMGLEATPDEYVSELVQLFREVWNDGWHLRQDIIWAKPNPMPESVKDRCTKSHEYLFLLTKSAHYYYDHESAKEKAVTGFNGLDAKTKQPRFGGKKYGDSNDPKHATKSGNEYAPTGMRNRRDVWTIATKPFKGAHFAVMPEALVEPCILAGSREGDLVLDPFAGSGTVGVVALRHQRNFVGVELNHEYAEMALKRIRETK